MERQSSRNQQELWQELPSLVEVSKPEDRAAPPALWRIGNKSLFQTNTRVQRRANKRLSLSRRTLRENIRQYEVAEEEIEREDECEDGPPSLTDSETDTEEEDSDDETLPPLIDSEAEEEEEDYDDDDLPDLVSEDEEDYEDEGIADCDTFISMDSLIVLLERYGLNNHQE